MEEIAQNETAGPLLESMQGSTLWQIMFLVLAAVFILTKALAGWQSGGPRQMMGLVGLAAAYASAIFIGPELASGLAPYIAGPHFLRTIIGGVILAVVVYGIVVIVGMYSFDSAREMEEGKQKRLYQTTGFALGTIYGLALVLIVVVAINIFGTVSRAMVEGTLAGEIQQADRQSIAGESGPIAVTTEIQHNKMAEWLARMQNSLQLGAGKGIVETVDFLPDHVYDMADKAVRVMADPVAMDRFAQNPAIQDIMQDPKIIDLSLDEELVHLLETKQYLAVMQHPKVTAAADDRRIQKLVTQEKVAIALDEALSGQQDVIQRAEEAGRLRYEER